MKFMWFLSFFYLLLSTFTKDFCSFHTPLVSIALLLFLIDYFARFPAMLVRILTLSLYLPACFLRFTWSPFLDMFWSHAPATATLSFFYCKKIVSFYSHNQKIELVSWYQWVYPSDWWVHSWMCGWAQFSLFISEILR